MKVTRRGFVLGAGGGAIGLAAGGVGGFLLDHELRVSGQTLA